MRQLLTTRIISILVGTAAFVFFFSGFGAVQAAKPEDPLENSERVKAKQITLEDKEVKKLLQGKRFRVLQTKLAELPVPKQAPSGIPRFAKVIIYNYTDDQVVAALANLESGAVVERKQHPSLQPRLHPEELAEAFQIAQSDERVQEILGGHQVVHEGIIVTPPVGSCDIKRCVELQFVLDGIPSSLVVLVNLSDQAVMNVEV